jgi:hypothetical protein
MPTKRPPVSDAAVAFALAQGAILNFINKNNGLQFDWSINPPFYPPLALHH